MGKGKLIERVLSGDILMGNGMFSPSLLAARNLRQGKGSYEQMRKALIAGGAKEDELVWSGFDQRFRNRGQVTREDVQSFLGENTDMVEDFTMQAEGISGSSIDESELVDRYVEQMLDEETEYYRSEFFPERVNDEFGLISELDAEDQATLANRNDFKDDVDGFLRHFGDGLYEKNSSSLDEAEIFDSPDGPIDEGWFGDAEDMARESLTERAQYDMGAEELYEALGLAPSDSGGTKYADYFTPGMSDYREDLFSFSDPYGLGTREAVDPHWAGVSDRTPLMHRRAANVQTVDGLPAFHVGELQSDWAQGSRGAERPTPQQEILLAGADDALVSVRQAEGAAQRTLLNNGLPAFNGMDRSDLGRLNGMENHRNQGNYHALSLANQPRFMQKSVMDDLMDAGDRGRAHAEANDSPFRPGYVAPSRSAYPNTDYLRSNTSTDQGGLPLGPSSEHRMADAFEAMYGPEIDDSRNTLSLLDQFPDDDQAAAPYTNKTERWVDYMLKRSLIDAAQGGDEFLTIGTGDMAKAMTGGKVDGQTAFYDDIVPRRLSKVIRQVDPKAEVRGARIEPDGSSMTVPGVRLTPDMRQKIRRDGLPSWAHPAANLGGGGLAGMLYQQGGGGAPRAPWEND